jgi:hypothetical protein
MFITVLFTIIKQWNHHGCPTADDWIKKMFYVFTVKYYTAIRKNIIMSCAVKGMKLEIIALREIS